MPVPKQYKSRYRKYLRECKENGIWPTVADFLGVKFTEEEIDCEPNLGAWSMSWKFCLARKAGRA